MEDWGGDCDVDSSEAKFDGGFTMIGNALGNDGATHEILFNVDSRATADVNWVSDEAPTGWNYSTDQANYTTYYSAEVGDVSVQNVSFSQSEEFLIDGNSHNMAGFQSKIDASALRQLLNPEIYKIIITDLFEKRANKIDYEPPGRDD